MNVGQVSASPGGSAGPLAALDLTAPVGAAPLVTYRAVRYLRLVAGPAAQALAFDAEGSALAGAFRHLDFDALSAGETSLRASTSSPGGGTVVVEFGAPRHLRSVRIATTKVPAGGYTLEVYRLDGDAIAGGPTTTATNGWAYAHRRKRADTRTEMVTIEAGGHVGPGMRIDIPDPAFALEFTDVRCALRLKDPSGDYVADFAPAHVEAIDVRSFPSSPRLAIGFPEDPTQPVGDPQAVSLVWQAFGEVGGAAPAADGEFVAGDALVATLDRFAERLSDAVRATGAPGGPVPTLPGTIDVALVIESDAPCRFEPSALGVAHRVVSEGFASGAEKEVLRFGEPGVEAGPVAVRLPGGAQVASAVMGATASLRDEWPADAGAAAAGAPPSSAAGVRIGGGRRAAQSIHLEAAAAVSGVLLGVLPLTTGAEFRAELVEDAAGAPAGRVLAAGTLAAGPAGRAAWLSLHFDAPLVITTAPHWLRLAAASGEATWLSAAGTGPALVLEDEGDAASSIIATLNDRDLLLHLLTAGGGDAAADAAPRLSVAGAEVTATASAGGRLEYDLAAPLQVALDALPPSGVAEIPLTLSSPVRGMVTLYPPRIEYDLPPP